MAIFTMAATFLLAAVGITGASTFVTGLVAVGLSLAATYAVSAVMKSLAGNGCLSNRSAVR
jgi:hypothetical protein